jgi:hypothetical protein
VPRQQRTVFHAAGIGAIAWLYFLQGARLSRETILAGMTNWKLHAATAGTRDRRRGPAGRGDADHARRRPHLRLHAR